MRRYIALIIEDDPDLSEIFSQALEAAGYQTEVIRDGQLALARLDDIEAATIILDLHLPNVPGQVILDQIKSKPKFNNTHIIITTADNVMAEILREKADIVLVKPISFGQLKDMAIRLKPQ